MQPKLIPVGISFDRSEEPAVVAGEAKQSSAKAPMLFLDRHSRQVGLAMTATAARESRLGLCNTRHSGNDPTHFDSLSNLQQYSTNEFMNGKATAEARIVDFQGKMY
jgi:hypothetical protein